MRPKGGNAFTAVHYPELGTSSRTLRIKLLNSTHQLGPEAVVIIDTPPGESAATVMVMKQSDFVIVPVHPTRADYTALVPFISSLEVPHAVVLTMVGEGSNANRYRELLVDQGVFVFDTVTPHHPTIDDFYGTEAESGLGGYSNLVGELENVLRALKQAAERCREQRESQKAIGDSLFRGLERLLDSPTYSL